METYQPDNNLKDLKSVFGEHLVGVMMRPQRWRSDRRNLERTILVVVWDSALAECIHLYQNYAVNVGLRLQPVDIIGLSQFETYVKKGVPAYVFSAIEGLIEYDPNKIIAHICNITKDPKALDAKQLTNLLEQKSKGHFDNVLVTLQRLIAEVYLGFEAGLQAKWLRKNDEVTYANIQSLSSWEQLKIQTNMDNINPQALELVSILLNDLGKLQNRQSDFSLGHDIIDIYMQLRDALRDSV